jgi:menaquinone-dependent protoporphyrinogen oxidase
MTRILIPYGSSEGQTVRIAEFLAGVIRDHGCEAFPVDARRSDAPSPDGYDAVMVGGSVHMGKYQRCIQDYVRENRAALERIPSAFFSVSLAAHEPTESARKEVQGCTEKFLRQTGWRPGAIGSFAGALLYTRYGFFTRWIMKKIARDKGSPDLDTSCDYVYTDWEKVRQFAEEFLETLAVEDAPELAEAGL